MQKVSYMGDGTTTEFTFNFPYFENTNIIVTKNGEITTGYTIIGTSAAPDADIPYTGGKVVFETAPTNLDSITIARHLPLIRNVDYQPTAKIEPTTLNQDLNYLMEVIKDRKDELDDLIEKYAEITNKELIETVLARIDAIHGEIVNIDEKITELGDISQINNDITSLKNAENFTTTGKNTITHQSMPSNSSVELTLGADGSSYTMPADGYLYLAKTSSASSQRIKFTNTSSVNMAVSTWSSGVQNLEIIMPVSKDNVVYVYYNAGGLTNQFRFIYANGTK